MRAALNLLLIQGKNAACLCGWGISRSDTYTKLLKEDWQLDVLEASVARWITWMDKFSDRDIDTIAHVGSCMYFRRVQPLMNSLFFRWSA